MTAPVWTPELERSLRALARIATRGWMTKLRPGELDAILGELDRLRESDDLCGDLLRQGSAQISEQRARIAELEAENAHFRASVADLPDHHPCAELEAENARLRARVDELAAAEAGMAALEKALVDVVALEGLHSREDLVAIVERAIGGGRMVAALQSLGSEHTAPAGWEDRVRQAVAMGIPVGLAMESESLLAVRRAEDAERVTITAAGRGSLRTDDAKCDLCDDANEAGLFLRGRCHPTAPLRVVLDGDVLTLRCYVPDCDRFVASFEVVPPSDDREAPPGQEPATPAIDLMEALRKATTCRVCGRVAGTHEAGCIEKEPGS